MSDGANVRAPIDGAITSTASPGDEPPADVAGDVGTGRVDLAAVPQRASNWFDELACHPDLTKAFGRFGGRLLNGTLTPADREVLILRTAWLTRCEYEWRHHARVALEAGVSEDALWAITQDDPGPLSSRHRVLVDAADQLHDRSLIKAETRKELAELLNEQQMLEVLFVAGFYRMVAGAMKSLHVRSEDQYLGVELPSGW